MSKFITKDDPAITKPARMIKVRGGHIVGFWKPQKRHWVPEFTKFKRNGQPIKVKGHWRGGKRTVQDNIDIYTDEYTNVK